MDLHDPFSLPALPYAYDSLIPAISEKTLYFHHSKHLQTYIDNLNRTVENCPVCREKTLVELLSQLNQLPLTKDIRISIQNNGGGVYNHVLYFNCMSPNGGGLPAGTLAQAISRDFGSFETWRQVMKKAAQEVFGSGYSWLVSDSTGKLLVVKTINQDCPLSYGFIPLLPIDVWEHAYYLDYQNKRNSYIDAWFGLINWTFVEKLYQF